MINLMLFVVDVEDVACIADDVDARGRSGCLVQTSEGTERVRGSK